MTPRDFVDIYDVKSLACCFSGGKDSLCATHYVLNELGDVNIDKYVVFVDTTVMVPCIFEYVDHCFKGFENLGANCFTLKPKDSFWELAKKWGQPSPTRRWCCFALKLEPILTFLRDKNCDASITGLRRDESRRREHIVEVIRRRTKIWSGWNWAPLVDWSEAEVVSYIEEHNLVFPPHYGLGIKETCCCGAFSSKMQMKILRDLYPDFFSKFVELEREYGYKSSAFYFSHKKVYAKDIMSQQTFKETKEVKE